MERTRPLPVFEDRPGGLDLFGADDQTTPGMVQVSSGPHREYLPVGNMTVGEIRRRFRDRFDLDPQSRPYLDGQDIGDETIVRPGQSLTFSRRAGEKG